MSTAVSHRDAILAAALECFLENSVAATTIDAIRGRSGSSVGTIYHHFGTKEGLATRLYVELLREYQEAYLVALESSRSARAGVEDSVAFHLRWVGAQPDRARYLFHCREPEVISRSSHEVKELNVRFYRVAVEWIRGHVERGRIRPMPARLCQALWMGPSLEYARLWLASTGRPAELREAEAALARAAWDAVRVR